MRHDLIIRILSFKEKFIFFLIRLKNCMSQKNSPKVDEKLILDWGTRIGLAVNADRERVERAERERLGKSQIENLIALLESVGGREALLATAAFALRQSARLEARSTGRVVANALLDLYSKGGTKDDARKMFVIAKWVSEASEHLKVGRVDYNTITLEDYLKQAIRGGR
jgi:hypothetical protein